MHRYLYFQQGEKIIFSNLSPGQKSLSSCEISPPCVDPRRKHNFCLSKIVTPRGLLVSHGRVDGEPQNLDADKSVLHILHSADVRAGHNSFSRTLGVSAKSTVVPRRTAGPGASESGHKFYTFYTEAAMAAAAALLGSSGMRTGASSERNIF